MASTIAMNAGPGDPERSGDAACPDQDEQRYEPADPFPDSDDDFEGDDGGRESEEAIPEDDD